MAFIRPSLTRVACAISGGVDSAVSAYLLKKKGFSVIGVFMTNWDQYDETLQCSTNVDREDAQYVCQKLGIEFCQLNFVREYWNEVFQPLVESYSKGRTPNPDILCNRFVKFEMLAKSTLKPVLSKEFGKPSNFSTSIDADAFATGHYAQNSLGNFLEHANEVVDPDSPSLLRAVDPVKDQTFWLCSISNRYLRYCMFPIGGLMKPEVKRIAREIGLERIANRRESMGMCFIGKRRFRDFIDNYIEPKHGLVKELETCEILGEHTGVHHFTLGQKFPGITRGNSPFYIAKLLPESQDILVVQSSTHPALFMRKLSTDPAVWISGHPPILPSSDYSFQWQNKWHAVPSNVEYNSDSLTSCDDLRITLEKPMRCVTPGQYAVLYNKDVCLGGAPISGSISLAEEDRKDPYLDWNLTDYEIKYPQTV